MTDDLSEALRKKDRELEEELKRGMEKIMKEIRERMANRVFSAVPLSEFTRYHRTDSGYKERIPLKEVVRKSNYKK
ncbi:hypothetical protein KY312_00870 [Candidatus Woesearchaeota archaeon]|nr:hypothetical protein [Candidatus Woesearchaeota archaeon]